eukprot:560199-Rhodomonas_salina.1
MPRSPNAHAPITLASAVLDLDQSEKAHSVLVEGVGICISAVDFVSVVCNKSLRDAHNTITEILEGKDADEAALLLCRKVDVKGFLTPTYVISYEECFDFIQFLPCKRVKNVKRSIDSVFNKTHSTSLSNDSQTIHYPSTMPSSTNAARAPPSTVAPAVLDMDESMYAIRDKVKVMDIDGVGPCITAIDFVSATCGKNRRDARNTITGMTTGNLANEVAEILCRKVDVPGFIAPTYVISYEECFDLVRFLPRTRVRDMNKHIASVFNKAHTNGELKDIITGVLNRNQGNTPEDTQRAQGPGYVYAAYSEGNGMKIGMTCNNNPMARIRSLNVCVKNPFIAVDLLRCGNPDEVERFLHEFYARLSVGDHNREMFDISAYDTRITFNVVRQAAMTLQATPEDNIDILQLKAHFRGKHCITFAGRRALPPAHTSTCSRD